MLAFKSIEELKGKTLTKVEAGSEEVVFETSEGPRYQLFHQQDCCESVVIREVEGDVSKLSGIVLDAVERPGTEPPGFNPSDSYTLTDFIIRTKDAIVTFKWLGESNGYYSESVYFIEL